MSDGMVQDKVVIVTGAGRGIGRDIALMMAQEGAKVVVNDLGGSTSGEGEDMGPAAEVAAEIEAMGGQAVANGDSVAEWDAAHNIVQTAIDTFGRVDAVVNNAGILRDRIFHKMSEEEFGAVIDVHLRGAFNVSRAVANYFRDQRSGKFVHMTSTSGLIGNYGQVNYAAAKLGIAGLSKCIALDMSRYNAQSNCISPFAWSRMIGTIPTNTPEEKARVEKIKTMTTDKIAPMAVFLASDSADEVSGQIFAVRKNEIFLMSQPRPIRSIHQGGGWSPKDIADHLLPAFKTSFYPLDRSADIFNWDPI